MHLTNFRSLFDNQKALANVIERRGIAHALCGEAMIVPPKVQRFSRTSEVLPVSVGATTSHSRTSRPLSVRHNAYSQYVGPTMRKLFGCRRNISDPIHLKLVVAQCYALATSCDAETGTMIAEFAHPSRSGD